MSVTGVVRGYRGHGMTTGGKPSKAKNAGRLVPWLSANVVNNLPKPVYRSCVTRWREASTTATCEWIESTYPFKAIRGPVKVSVRLYKATNHEIDPFAISEGAKPLVDGLEAAGLILNDRLAFPGHMEALKAATRAECRVELVLSAVTP